MKTLAVLGRKGGGGKTACSHILALAFGLAGHKPILVQTDLRTAAPPIGALGRPYWLFGLDASHPEQAAEAMRTIFDRASKTEGSIVILDGGANRDAIDEALAMRSDLVLIPVADGPEDLEVAEQDRHRFEGRLAAVGKTAPVRLVLNRWPGRKAELDPFLREDYVAAFMERTQGLRLQTMVPRFRSVKALLDHGSPEGRSSVRKVGRQLLEEITGLLDISELRA